MHVANSQTSHRLCLRRKKKEERKKESLKNTSMDFLVLRLVRGFIEACAVWLGPFECPLDEMLQYVIHPNGTPLGQENFVILVPAV